MKKECIISINSSDKGETIVCTEHGIVRFIAHKDYLDSREFARAVMVTISQHEKENL